MEFDSLPIEIPSEDRIRLQDAFLATNISGFPDYKLSRLYTDGKILLQGTVIRHSLDRHVALKLPYTSGGHQLPFIIVKNLTTAESLRNEMDITVRKHHPN